MRDMGSLIKNITVVCCTCLLICLISFVGLNAQEKSKNEKNNKDIRSVQDDRKIENEQFNNDAIEDIEPPEEEDWIEPGDKELYTLKLNCITPKMGITGGVLIYYGVYIKPPYELKIVNDTLLINNLAYNGPLDFRKKLSDRWMARIDAIKLTDEEEKYSSRLEKVINEIQKMHDNLIEKYKDEYEKNISEVINELDQFLKNHEQIDVYKIYPGILVDFKIKNSLDPGMYHLQLKKNLRTIRNPKTDPPAKESDKAYLESLLSSSFVERYQVEMRVLDNFDMYLAASHVLNKPFNDITKIKKLFLIFGNIYKAKLVFYNFNYVEFLAEFGEKNND